MKSIKPISGICYSNRKLTITNTISRPKSALVAKGRNWSQGLWIRGTGDIETLVEFLNFKGYQFYLKYYKYNHMLVAGIFPILHLLKDVNWHWKSHPASREQPSSVPLPQVCLTLSPLLGSPGSAPPQLYLFLFFLPHLSTGEPNPFSMVFQT
jgi:hypothetical protein